MKLEGERPLMMVYQSHGHVVEYLHENSCKSKTLFATHYHELNDMSSIFDRIKNYNVSVKEVGKKIIFIRTLAEGGSEHSFGIHVAKNGRDA